MSGWFKDILISEVQRRPILWQDSNKNFKNKNVTDVLWRDVGLVCGLSGHTAKAKWKNLKDQFRKEYRKSSKPGTKRSKWKYLNSLLFLIEIVGPSSNHVDINDVTDETQQSCKQELDPLNLNIVKQETTVEYYDDVDQDISNDNHSNESSRKLELITSTTQHSEIIPRSTSTKRKRKISNFEEEHAEQQSKEELLNTTENADMQFFRSLLPYMEQLPLIYRLELRTNIQQMVLDKYRKTQE